MLAAIAESSFDIAPSFVANYGGKLWKGSIRHSDGLWLLRTEEVGLALSRRLSSGKYWE